MRKLALWSLAAFSEMQQGEQLIAMYADPIPSVRAAAYYASGQVGCATCVNDMMNRLAQEKDPNALLDLYEGIGKIGRLLWDPKLDTLVSQSADHQRGAAWHLYRCGLRGDVIEEDVLRAVALLGANDEETRRGAAHFLQRTADLDLTPHLALLDAAFTAEQSSDVRMALVGAYRHVNPVLISEFLGEVALSDPNPMVRVQALRTYGRTQRLNKEHVAIALFDANHQISSTAAGLLDQLDWTDEEVTALWKDWNEQMKASSPVPPQLEGLYLLSLDASMRQSAWEDMVMGSTQYARAGHLAALRNVPGFERVLVHETAQGESPVVRTTACEMLIHQVESGTSSYAPGQMAWGDVMANVLGSGDVTAMGLMAEHIAEPAMDYTAQLVSMEWLTDARKMLELPRELETALSIDKAIAFLKNESFTPPLPAWNTAVDWNALEDTLDYAALITTNRGTFRMNLNQDWAPRATINFISLAESGFFDGKAFHRIVPNFVAQTGCPRGDGWGSTDQSNRSEFGPHNYCTGAVGMASVGADTESCQWFITQSPTPHLEGRYTCFGQVLKGMEIVSSLEVGDRIESVEILTRSKALCAIP